MIDAIVFQGVALMSLRPWFDHCTMALQVSRRRDVSLVGGWISRILVNSEKYLETRSFTSWEIPVFQASELKMSGLSCSMSIDLILCEEIHLLVKVSFKEIETAVNAIMIWWNWLCNGNRAFSSKNKVESMARRMHRLTNMLPQLKRFQQLKKVNASRIRFVVYM